MPLIFLHIHITLGFHSSLESCECSQRHLYFLVLYHVVFSHNGFFSVQTWNEILMFLQYVEQKAESVTEWVKQHMSNLANLLFLLLKHNTFHCHL